MMASRPASEARPTAASLFPEPPRSILVVMMSAVGDAVLVLPVVSALRRAFPDAHIAWVLQPLPYSLVRGHPAVDEFLVFERGRRGRSPAALRQAWGGLRAAVEALRASALRQHGGRFDLILALQVYLKAGLLTALTPACVKLGFDRRRARDLNWLATTHRLPPPPERYRHVQDQYFEFLTFLGVDPHPVTYGLVLSPEEEEERGLFFRSFTGLPCAVVLATSDPRKDWTPDGYAAVIRELGTRFGFQPFLVGGRSPREEAMAKAVTEAVGGRPLDAGVGASATRSLAGSCGRLLDARGGGLRRLLALLSGSALVITPDTGPLHIARALEKPVVSLFGFTNPRRSGPYRMFEDLVVDGYARWPGEPYPLTPQRRRAGMARITPSMVLEKVELAVERYL